MRRYSLLLVALATPVNLSCGATRSGGTGSEPPPAWENALKSLGTLGNSVYSFRFDAAAPAQPYFQVGVHDASAEVACARYTGTDPGPSEFWFLETIIFDLQTGPHDVVVASPQGAPSPTGTVTLLHRNDNAYVDSYEALAGTINVDFAPSLQESKLGSRLSGSIDADFPLHALQEVMCHGGRASGPDATVHQECTCRDDNNQRSSCIPPPGLVRCCYDVESPRIHVRVPFAAVPCPGMCKYATGLPDYCLGI